MLQLVPDSILCDLVLIVVDCHPFPGHINPYPVQALHVGQPVPNRPGAMLTMDGGDIERDFRHRNHLWII